MARTPAGDPVAGREDHHAAPRGNRTEATLAFTRGASDIHIHPEQVAARLFTARFTGRQPAVSVARGTVSVGYPAGLDLRTGGEVALNPDVTWTIRIQGGASGQDAVLARVGLSATDIDGGASNVMLRLPPHGDITVPLRIGGAQSAARSGLPTEPPATTSPSDLAPAT